MNEFRYKGITICYLSAVHLLQTLIQTHFYNQSCNSCFPAGETLMEFVNLLWFRDENCVILQNGLKICQRELRAL